MDAKLRKHSMSSIVGGGGRVCVLSVFDLSYFYPKLFLLCREKEERVFSNRYFCMEIFITDFLYRSLSLSLWSIQKVVIIFIDPKNYEQPDQDVMIASVNMLYYFWSQIGLNVIWVRKTTTVG